LGQKIPNTKAKMPLPGKKSTFRSLIAVFTVVFFVVLGFSQVNSALASVPREINYQSRLRSSTLAPITVPTDIQFSIYSSQTLGAYTDTASSSGPLLWKGVYDGGACPQITPDADGYFAVQLGSACAPFPSYIDWNQTLFLGVQIGVDAEATPRVQLSAFPYALNAEAVDTFSASSTAAANTLLALDQNLNFNILTGGFLGAYFTMSSSTVTSTIAGNFDVQGNTTLGDSASDLISVNGRFNTDLVPALDLAYSLGSATNRWNGVFGTVTTTNLNVLGSSNFTNITWVNATGTNTTSTNLFTTNFAFQTATGGTIIANIANFATATVSGVAVCLQNGVGCASVVEADTLASVTNRGNFATSSISIFGTSTLSNTVVTGTLTVQGLSTLQDIAFQNATGVSLNLTNTLYINTVAINATGTTSTNSGAWLIGVFDEFTFSNATSVQAALRDLDLAIANVSTTETDTLQTVTNRGNSTTNTIQFAGGTSTGVFNITGVGTSTVSDNFQIIGHMTVGNAGIIDGGSVFASTPGSVVLNVEEEFTSPLADYTRGIASFLRLNSGEASTPASVSAYESSVETAGATNFTSEISGIRGQVSHIGTGVLQTAYGSIGISAIGGVGTIGNSIGVFGQSYSFGAGNVTSAYALYGESFNNGGGASITNNYGLFLGNQAGVGVNNYNLYSAGSNSLNVMEGSLGVGVTTATSRLQVNSGASTIVPIFTLQNTNGDIQMFNATGSPEGFVSGSVGDLAVDLVGGRFYIKETGTATVNGWAPFATGTGSAVEADTLQTVTNRGNSTTLAIMFAGATSNGDILPGANLTYQLGSTSSRWSSLFAATVYVGSSTWALAQDAANAFTVSGPAGGERMRIDADGNMMVGATTTDARFRVNSNQTRIANFSSDDDTEGVSFSADSYGAELGLTYNSGAHLLVSTHWAPTIGGYDYVYLGDRHLAVRQSTGYVGIGTPDPSSSLDVQAFATTSGFPILTLGNSDGNFQIFNTIASPEGVVFGAIGDIAVDSSNGRMYLKETGTSTNTGWSRVATGTGSVAEADTLQTVTNRGNSTTNDIVIQRALPEGTTAATPFITLTDATATTEGIVVGKYNQSPGENNSTFIFTNDTALLTATSSAFIDYSHINNNLLIRTNSGGSLASGLSIGSLINLESTLNQGMGPAASVSISNYGTIRGFLGISNPQTNIDFFLATGTPQGLQAANSGSLWFNHAATSSPFLYIKTTDGPNTGWVGIATLNDISTSTASTTEVDTFQTVTNRGNATTNTIVFAGATSNGDILPGTNLTYQLGSTSSRWSSLFAGTVYVGSSTWALQQGTDGSFGVRSSSNLDDALRIRTNGDVGIGTSEQGTVPLARLHVLGGPVLMGGNLGEEIFSISIRLLTVTVSLGDYSGWN
jgi:hypothetical protein